MPPYMSPPTQPTPGSGGTVAKWLVIGCLGCSGIIALVFIGLIVLGMLSSDGEPDRDVGTTPTATWEPSDGGGEDGLRSEPAEDEGSTESTPEAPDTAAPADPAGASVQTEVAIMTVTSTERTQVLRDSFFESTTDNEYFVVNLEYTNTSSEAHDLWASDFVLVDTEGREHSTNTDASLAVEEALIIEEVNPGLTYRGTLVFEVPPGTEFTELRLEESFGTSESLVISFP